MKRKYFVLISFLLVSLIIWGYFATISKTQDTKNAENNVKIRTLIVALKEGVTLPERQALIKEIAYRKGVKDVIYLSKDDNLKKYSEQNKDNPDLVSETKSEMFQETLEVYLKDFKTAEELSQFTKTRREVDGVWIVPIN